MNKSIYLNWRFHVLFLLAMVTIFLLFSDCEDITIFFVSKLIGAVLGYISFQLFKHWNKNEKLNGIMELIEEDD
ncbi:hypothetical protein KZO77_01815 [Prevotella melaninogenica]|jgi:hypothetical protein|uniref:Uncharacterized protein n=1 Tax=Prevotella melaninogenica TaxID=28132 RepID=A0ABS6Y2Q6_9BACT|nr:hypothetical protein [Prevotella melaninogenica]MBW4753778.1 hypothetical protein [Prevotella melaninogenica]